mgnify:CR=1 FL=1
MTIMGITLSAATLWLIFAAVLAVIEALSLGLVCIWFAGGAIIAAIAAMMGASTVIQIVVFLAASIILLILTKPIVSKRLNNKTEKTNIDAVIGSDGIAESQISQYQHGQVRADGKIWTAVCNEGTIEKGDIVIIKSVKGVTLTVEKK